MRWRAVDDVIGIGTDAAVGDAAKDSIVDSDKFKRVLAEDGVDAGSKTLGLAYVDVPSLVNLATRSAASTARATRRRSTTSSTSAACSSGRGRDGDTVTSDVFVEST